MMLRVCSIKCIIQILKWSNLTGLEKNLNTIAIIYRQEL